MKIMMTKVGDMNNKYAENITVTSCQSSQEEIQCKKRKPKRVLHFSDGTLEEYSSDEEISRSTLSPNYGQVLKSDQIEHLKWFPWFWYQTTHAGSKALAVCDYLGETLANFFGILSPKYEYEIEQYKRAIVEEEERRKEDAELGSLSQSPSDDVQTDQPRY